MKSVGKEITESFVGQLLGHVTIEVYTLAIRMTEEQVRFEMGRVIPIYWQLHEDLGR